MAFAVYTAWGNDYDGQLWLVRIIMQIMQKVHRWVCNRTGKSRTIKNNASSANSYGIDKGSKTGAIMLRRMDHILHDTKYSIIDIVPYLPQSRYIGPCKGCVRQLWGW